MPSARHRPSPPVARRARLALYAALVAPVAAVAACSDALTGLSGDGALSGTYHLASVHERGLPYRATASDGSIQTETYGGRLVLERDGTYRLEIRRRTAVSGRSPVESPLVSTGEYTLSRRNGDEATFRILTSTDGDLDGETGWVTPSDATLLAYGFRR